MPRYDGTGPRGVGPMTGHGEGYCILELSESGTPARGYAGLANTPVRGSGSPAMPGRRSGFRRRCGRAPRRGRRLHRP